MNKLWYTWEPTRNLITASTNYNNKRQSCHKIKGRIQENKSYQLKNKVSIKQIENLHHYLNIAISGQIQHQR